MALVSSFEGFIFDYGGVLVHDQSDADQARLAEIVGAPKDAFTNFYWSERPDYDKALIDACEYWQRIAGRFGNTLTQTIIDQLTEIDATSWMQFDSVMWDWVAQLHAAGKRLAMLSNMPWDLGEALKTRTQKLSNFDHLTLSYEVRAVKPDPVVYDHCLEGLGTPPEQTLFLDDRIANIQAAELLGIRAILFTSRDEIRLRLCG